MLSMLSVPRRAAALCAEARQHGRHRLLLLPANYASVRQHRTRLGWAKSPMAGAHHSSGSIRRLRLLHEKVRSGPFDGAAELLHSRISSLSVNPQVTVVKSGAAGVRAFTEPHRKRDH